MSVGNSRHKMHTIICIIKAIGIDFVKRTPDSSIVFIGENKEDEDKCNMQRYRIYKMLTANIVSDTLFTHVVLDEQSSYLLVSKQVPNFEEYLLWVKEYMIATYSDFSVLEN